jgi:hypothetical protein
MQDTRPCYQGADTVKTESPDEDRFIAVVAEDVVCVAQGSEGVCSVMIGQCEWGFSMKGQDRNREESDPK